MDEAKEKEPSWRDRFRPVIAEIIQTHSDKSKRKLKGLLFRTWPGHQITARGARQIWIDEIFRQLYGRSPLMKKKHRNRTQRRHKRSQQKGQSVQGTLPFPAKMPGATRELTILHGVRP
jgi:hypothetical protein